MGRVKNVVYQFSDNLLQDDEQIDLTGELHFTKGDIIVKGGLHWRVYSITMEEPIQKLERPTLWLDLVHAPVN
jgi:hypothetical protein